MLGLDEVDPVVIALGRVAIVEATESNIVKLSKEMEKYKNEIKLSRNQVEYCKELDEINTIEFIECTSEN